MICHSLPRWFFVTVGLTLCLTGCRGDQAKQGAPPPPAVTVARPVTAKVQTYYQYNGNLQPVEMVEVKARVKGFLNEVTFTEGDEVEKGDVLFKIDPREYEALVKKAEADRLKAVADVKRAKSDEKRSIQLLKEKAISSEEFEQRVAARETADAILLQAEALLEANQLQLDYTKISAPIRGQISRTQVTPGNLVGQNESTLLTTIVSMDPLYVYFDAPERDLIEFQRLMQASAQPELSKQSVPVEIGVTTEVDFPHVGQIDFRENRVDMGTGTVRIRGKIPNPKVPPGNARLLYPGLFARVRVPSGAPRDLLAIPEDALMTGQEGRFVYVLGEGDVVQKRTVKIGPNVWKATGDDAPSTIWKLLPPASGGKETQAVTVPSVIAIESGLKLTDRVVVNGLTKARPGAAVAPALWELKSPQDNAK